MRDGVRHITDAVDELLDLVQHAVDGVGERVELIAAATAREPMTEIALDDGQNGLTDAMDACQDGTADHYSAQHAGDRQYRHRTAQSGPEVPGQGSELRHVA